MKTSVGIQAATRDHLQVLKPEGMGWDAFLTVLARSSDPDRFQELVDAEQRMGQREAADVARARYFHYRRRKGLLLEADALKERVRLRRLSHSLLQAAETLQKTTESEHLPPDRVLSILERVDADLHQARALLSHHARGAAHPT